MDPVAEYLQSIRTAHVTLLAALIVKTEAEHEEAAGEVLVESADVFGGFMRIDATANGPRFFELDVLAVPELEVGMGLEIEEARIAFGRFSWNSCRVQAKLEAGDEYAELLQDWITDWMDVDDVNDLDAQGLAGVIHSVKDVTYAGGVLTCIVDLGSAPDDAIHDLMMGLVSIGAETIVFGGNITL